MRLFVVFTHAAERHVEDFSMQSIVNAAWAFSLAGLSVSWIFSALARAYEQSEGEITGQILPLIVWLFTTTNEPTPAMLLPQGGGESYSTSVLHDVTSQRVKLHKMVMHRLAATGQIVAGFLLLAQAGVSGALSHPDENCYSMFRMLLEACRTAADCESTSRVHEAAQRLGLIADAPVAQILRQPDHGAF
eukprot:gnl/TRDRNA2_/TRDRNA2_173385_c5_seq17.p1 gnl/TRDRNA2_/TRDRNA2_173385_c5~~gnl/TRDRNA2_/TRDRNA2_173385_c5_seq17.p1  ORF type:complete len:190 (+),score=17.07 gnl/TRDRNA2_/TRDRNA2_173385_c5_seq17:266-835(+)